MTNALSNQYFNPFGLCSYREQLPTESWALCSKHPPSEFALASDCAQTPVIWSRSLLLSRLIVLIFICISPLLLSLSLHSSSKWNLTNSPRAVLPLYVAETGATISCHHPACFAASRTQHTMAAYERIIVFPNVVKMRLLFFLGCHWCLSDGLCSSCKVGIPCRKDAGVFLFMW